MDQQILRKAEVHFRNDLAGHLFEMPDGYVFQYDEDFLKYGVPIATTLPLRKEPFKAKELFPFFQGLLPEGWYLNIVSMTQKVDSRDLFGLLLSTTNMDTIGAVTVKSTE